MVQWFPTALCCNLGHLHCKHSISWNWNLHRWGLLLSYLAAGPCNFSHKPRWTKVSHSKFSRKRWTLAAPGIIINLEQKSLFSIIYGLHNFWRSLLDKIAFSKLSNYVWRKHLWDVNSNVSSFFTGKPVKTSFLSSPGYWHIDKKTWSRCQLKPLDKEKLTLWMVKCDFKKVFIPMYRLDCGAAADRLMF